MVNIIKRLIVRAMLRTKRLSTSGDIRIKDLKKAKKNVSVVLRRYTTDFILIVIGIFSAAFGFKGFLLSNHFIDGGATGISLLISALTVIPLYVLIIIVNAPFVILAYRVIGKIFAIKAALAIAGLSLCLAVVDFPIITNDNLLVALFGGFFLGLGIGCVMRGGAVIDGTEVLAIFLSKKIGITMGDFIFMANVIIFSVAAYLLGIEIALYSMITYLSASKTLDFIIEGIEEYSGVTIISGYSQEIREMIVNEMHRGVTVYNGKNGYGRRGEVSEVEIIYTVVTRLELNRLNMEIEKIDPEAFIVVNSLKDARGGKIKRRSLKH